MRNIIGYTAICISQISMVTAYCFNLIPIKFLETYHLPKPDVIFSDWIMISWLIHKTHLGMVLRCSTYCLHWILWQQTRCQKHCLDYFITPFGCPNASVLNSLIKSLKNQDQWTYKYWRMRFDTKNKESNILAINGIYEGDI